MEQHQTLLNGNAIMPFVKLHIELYRIRSVFQNYNTYFFKSIIIIVRDMQT